jgi:hypothetical protein
VFGQRFIEYTPAIEQPTVPATMLADVKAYLGLTTTAEDAQITAMLGPALRMAEAYCSRALVRRAIVETLFGDGVDTFLVREAPILSVASIKVGGQTQTLTDFYIDKNHGAIKWKSSGPAWPDNWSDWGNAFGQSFNAFSGEVVVTYDAGYSTLPELVTQAIAEIVKVSRNLRKRDPSVGRQEVPDVGSVEYIGFRGLTSESASLAAGNSSGFHPAFATAVGYLNPYRRRIV